MPSHSSEGEGKRLDARVQKFDCEDVVRDAALLPHELIQAVSGHNAVALRVRIHPMTLSRSLPVNCHSEANRLAVRTRTEHKVPIASVEMKDDLSPGGLKHSNLLVIGPSARKSSLVQLRMSGLNIELLCVSRYPSR